MSERAEEVRDLCVNYPHLSLPTYPALPTEDLSGGNSGHPTSRNATREPVAVDGPADTGKTAEGVTQTLLAGRDDGVPGNCVQAAIASLLGLPIDAVPHFLLWLEWNHVMVEWLAEKGYQIRCWFYDAIPAERCIVAGMSPRGVAHVCIAEGGEIIWDPHPSRAGLTKIDEIWTIEPITPEGR